MQTAGLAALVVYLVNAAEDLGLPAGVKPVAAILFGLALAAAQMVSAGQTINLGTVAFNGLLIAMAAVGAPQAVAVTHKAAQRQVARIRAARALKANTAATRAGARPVSRP